MPAVCLNHKTKMSSIAAILKKNEFNGFPIVNRKLSCIGLISRHALMVVIKNVEKVPNSIANNSQDDKLDSEENYALNVTHDT